MGKYELYNNDREDNKNLTWRNIKETYDGVKSTHQEKNTNLHIMCNTKVKHNPQSMSQFVVVQFNFFSEKNSCAVIPIWVPGQQFMIIHATLESTCTIKSSEIFCNNCSLLDNNQCCLRSCDVPV